MSPLFVPCPGPSLIGCEPEAQAFGSAAYYLRNKKKKRNFIMADVTDLGYFHFYVENLPKDRTGCPGWWLFQVAWEYFKQEQNITIQGVRGDWTSGDNLDMV